MKSLWYALAVLCVSRSASFALALDEFDRHTSGYLKQAAEKHAAVATLSSAQATKLKTLGRRVEHACVIVRTTDGNWAKALVSWGFRKAKDAKGKDSLVPIAVLERYVTYDGGRGDVTLAHGRNVMLFPNYEFDVDIGQVVPTGTGADLKFTPERLLASLGTAKLHPLDGSALPPTPPDKYDPQDHPEVRPRDFAGAWRVNADGRWIGWWEIEIDGEGMVSGRYTSEETKATFPLRGRIAETDIRHRLRFEVEFAAASQQYDLYLWTTDKSMMAGTTTLINRTFGVVAERQAASDAPSKTKTTTSKQSAQQRLQQRISWVFDGTLEEGLSRLGEKAGVSIRVNQKDLAPLAKRLQRVSVNHRDEPTKAVLRNMLRAADPSGSLVYVIRGGSGQEIIEVTTREAATRRGDRLPVALRVPLTERLKEPVSFHTDGKLPIADALERFSRETHTGLLMRRDELPPLEAGQGRVELDAKDKPRGEVLRTLLKSAYGDPVIYVLANVDSEEYLVITTREAAESRGDKVPPEFAMPK